MARINLQAEKQAKLLWEEDFVVLDTETTGLTESAELVEISIVDKNGMVVLNSLIKPLSSIPSSATKIHGISNSDVKDAPSWADVYPKYRESVKGKLVLIYNKKYDTRIIRQTCQAYGLSTPRIKSECVMLLYAAYRNVVNKRTGDYKWHKLTEAIAQNRLPQSEAHRALGDCQMTSKLLAFMSGNYAGSYISDQEAEAILSKNVTERSKGSKAEGVKAPSLVTWITIFMVLFVLFVFFG